MVPRAAGATFPRPMPHDPGLVERVDGVLPRPGARGVRQKAVFGGRGFLPGMSTFLIVWGDGLLVKTPRAGYAAALGSPGVTPFAPDGKRPMSTWVIVPADGMADDPELADWVARRLRAAG